MICLQSIEEFNHNVVAVHTVELWDHQLSELTERYVEVISSRSRSKNKKTELSPELKAA